jgi:hypothetical protein
MDETKSGPTFYAVAVRARGADYWQLYQRLFADRGTAE